MIKISDAECEVMQVIWEKKDPTSNEIIEILDKPNWNGSTVRTLLRRLQDKGAVEAIKDNRKVFRYVAQVDQNEYRMRRAKDLIKKLYHDSIGEFVWQYCKASGISKEEMKKIIEEVIKKCE